MVYFKTWEYWSTVALPITISMKLNVMITATNIEIQGKKYLPIQTKRW
jgi:hypothetical protein